MVAIMDFYIKKHQYDEETRKAKLRDWRKRYKAAFPYGDEFCNWLKLPWNDKPVTPKYLKEYEFQKALVHEFYEYQGVYDGLPSDHKYHGNGGKYHYIFFEEHQKIIAHSRKKWDEQLRKIRGSNVTVGNTPNRPRGKKEKRIRREFCD